MKTLLSYKIFIPVLIIGAIGFIIRCDKLEELITEAVDSVCPDSVFSKRIDNQLIIDFEQKVGVEQKHLYYDSLKIFADAKSITVRDCNCDENLVLVEVETETPLDMEGWKRRGNASLSNEGDAYYNFTTKLQDIGKPYSSTYRNQPEVGDIDIVVAVMDGGISADIFPGTLSQNYDFTEGGTLYTPVDIHPHGTLVSMIIMKSIPDAVVSKVKLMDLRIFDKDGNGTLFDALCAFSFASQNRVDIINASWGFYPTEYEALEKYIQKAQGENIVVVASAGNKTMDTDYCLHFPSGFNNNVIFPAIRNVIGVASLEKGTDNLASYSNYGASTIAVATEEGDFNIPEYSGAFGTSYAAPVVTSMAVQLEDMFPSDPYNKIIDCILNSTTPVSGLKIINGKLNETITCP